ncbi:acetyltransferase [Sandarakinorhabdus sp.]|uniref:acetyltransferase n=1 Tax=Sandarakinorhabdus sp. TaxID=1916663 RepID=UPI0033428BA9
MQKLIFFGSGGVAREVTSWTAPGFIIAGYATLDAAEHARFGLPGQAFSDDVTPGQAGTDLAVIAIGLPGVRRRLGERLAAAGFRFATLVHPSAVMASNAVIGEGSIVCPLVNISPNVTVGRLSYINFCVGIGHDATIGDYAQINPGVQIGGFATIGTGALIGSGATVREGVTVGDGATVASGSVVFAGVRPGVTVLGNPAKRMRAFED